MVWNGAVAGALGLALAACNGSTPTPSPSPTPTPTGTPTPAPTPTPVAFTTSEAALQYELIGGTQTVANLTSAPPSSGTVFSFTPTTNGYTYTLLNGTVTPSASEQAVFPVASIKTCERVTLCFGTAFAHQQVANGASSYFLSRFIAGSTQVLFVQDVSLGVFEESLTGGTAVDFRPFAYGVATPTAGIPTTGTPTLNGLLIGQGTGNKPGGTGTSNIYRLAGLVQFVPNYPAGTATLKLTIEGTPTGCTTCPPVLNQVFDATGTVSAGVANFALPGGNARLFLAGATGGEVGGTFLLTLADPNDAGVTMTLVGSVAGRL